MVGSTVRAAASSAAEGRCAGSMLRARSNSDKSSGSRWVSARSPSGMRSVSCRSTVPTGGRRNGSSLVSSSYAITPSAKTSAAQVKLASAIMDPGFQSAFNVVKGSAPARTDVPDTAFDDCGKKAIKDVAEANKNNTLVGSIAHGHAVPASIKNAFYDVITRHFNGQIDDKKAVAEMVAAAKN